MDRLRKLLVVFAILCSTSLTACSTEIADQAIVSTRFGKLAGRLDAKAGSYAWLGIPYAAPPTGPGRWRAPTEPKAWATTRQAKEFGSACAQIGSTWGPQPEGEAFGLSLKDNIGRVVGSEDCLTLNIWRPKDAKGQLPVLFFIHGGSDETGWSGTPDYWGANLASAQQIVVVTVNYRLNVFGWFKEPALENGNPADDSGNFGTLDLIQALKFVQNNIGQFGGDASNVTLAGQSAGAINVWSLILAPKASGLFHKAVTLSGGQTATSVDSAKAFAGELMRQLIIKGGLASDAAGADAFIAAHLGNRELKKDYLYRKTTRELIDAFVDSGNFSGIIYDGKIQPASAASAFAKVANPVPVLAGNTHDEGKVWSAANVGKLSEADLWEVQWTFNAGTSRLAISDLVRTDFLPVDKPFVSCSDTGYNGLFLPPADFPGWRNCNYGFNTRLFWHMVDITLDLYRPFQAGIYAYDFSWAQQPEPWKTFYGANHLADVAFMFGNFGPGLYVNGYTESNRPGREELARRMQKSLKAFMMTGNPNNESLGVAWLPWPAQAGSAHRLVFDADLSEPQIGQSNTTWRSR